MDISRLTKEYITKECNKAFKKSKQSYEADYKRGWKDAIAFAKKVARAYTTCEQCGKLIISPDDYNPDGESAIFCDKCFDKLFSKGKIKNEDLNERDSF